MSALRDNLNPLGYSGNSWDIINALWGYQLCYGAPPMHLERYHF